MWYQTQFVTHEFNGFMRNLFDMVLTLKQGFTGNQCNLKIASFNKKIYIQA